ncbi:MATE efflux family protein [Abeliophyllum distichum]|uniref:MATE efflux family protein n=1 Tax=Abeliophyllum distichum TaxID=126358 RepID=A0ABD1VYH4_9LAMI
MGSALETLAGQAYGAKQYHMPGIYTQRAILILLSFSIPLAFIWFYTSIILITLGQDQDISVGAGVFNRWMIPGLFAYGILQCLNRFLQTQNTVVPMMISSGIAALLHIIVCWLFVFKIELGIIGAALANAISYWINVLLLALYIKFSPACSKTFLGFSREAFDNLLGFLKLAIPSAIMICLDLFLLCGSPLEAGQLDSCGIEDRTSSQSDNQISRYSLSSGHRACEVTLLRGAATIAAARDRIAATKAKVTVPFCCLLLTTVAAGVRHRRDHHRNGLLAVPFETAPHCRVLT